MEKMLTIVAKCSYPHGKCIVRRKKREREDVSGDEAGHNEQAAERSCILEMGNGNDRQADERDGYSQVQQLVLGGALCVTQG